MNEASERTPLARPKFVDSFDLAARVRILTAVISLAEGYDIGVVNGAVVLFREELQLTSWQVGIALSIFPMGVAICSPIAGSFADWAGRKPSMMLSALLLTIGGLVMAFSNSFETIAVGRIIAGSGAGVGLTTVTAYMSEVSPAHARGFYGSLEELFVNVGNVTGYLMNVALLGHPYDWRIMLGLGIIPSICVLVVLMLPYRLTGIPESPRYLQKVGRCEEARAILSELLRGDEAEVEKATKAWMEEARQGTNMASWGEAITAFATTHRRSALAGIGCGILNMFTGIMLMMVTTTSLLVGTGMSKDQAMWVSVGLGSTKALVMLVVAVFVLDSWGRRPLLLCSLSVCAAAAFLGSAGAYFNWGEAWVVLGLCVFVTGYSIGVGPVPWVYMPEVLENRLRGKGCALGLTGARLCGATHIFLFPILFPLVGVEGLFLFLLAVNILACMYVYAFCPETMGLSLEQIQDIFVSTSDEKVP
jgi:sugar porter (SP) family MFS transporter|mmetsp:Transcript_99952/g.158196  ORF Transcript_99952/g.158196 Transcript_99952/m.158196 type:complete len:476 (-) Transcript_99952:22-1449(-)